MTIALVMHANKEMVPRMLKEFLAINGRSSQDKPELEFR
jgi:hypothetical protein